MPVLAPRGATGRAQRGPHGILGLDPRLPHPCLPLEGGLGSASNALSPRAEGNPGTSSSFLGDPLMPHTAPLPRKTLQLSQLKDQAVEAQAQQPGQHIHAAAGLRARGGVPPPAPAHRPGAGRQVCGGDAGGAGPRGLLTAPRAPGQPQQPVGPAGLARALALPLTTRGPTRLGLSLLP